MTVCFSPSFFLSSLLNSQAFFELCFTWHLLASSFLSRHEAVPTPAELVVQKKLPHMGQKESMLFKPTQEWSCPGWEQRNRHQPSPWQVALGAVTPRCHGSKGFLHHQLKAMLWCSLSPQFTPASAVYQVLWAGSSLGTPTLFALLVSGRSCYLHSRYQQFNYAKEMTNLRLRLQALWGLGLVFCSHIGLLNRKLKPWASQSGWLWCQTQG